MIWQLSVFLENRTGRAAEMARLLAETGHNLRSLMIADTSEFGVVRMIVDRPLAAREALEVAGFGVSATRVVAVEVPDTPGALADVLEVLDGGALNVEYAYAFVEPSGGRAANIFRMEEPERAVKVLEAAGYRLLAAGDIYVTDDN
jgi:hypothetical protein